MTSVTTTCRDLAELISAAQTACRLLFQECFKSGIKNILRRPIAAKNARIIYMLKDVHDQGRL